MLNSLALVVRLLVVRLFGRKPARGGRTPILSLPKREDQGTRDSP